MTIYERIRSLRESRGMSQEDLAVLVGYKSRSAINKIESGIRDINQSQIIAFSNALGTSPSFLMGWSEEESNAIESKDVAKLFEYYHKLNDIGKKEAINRVEELTHIPRYQLTPVFEIRAAHNEAELTEEEKDKMRKDLDDL